MQRNTIVEGGAYMREKLPMWEVELKGERGLYVQGKFKAMLVRFYGELYCVAMLYCHFLTFVTFIFQQSFPHPHLMQFSHLTAHSSRVSGAG